MGDLETNRCGVANNDDFYLYIPIKENGDEIQKISVVQTLPSLIIQDSRTVLEKILPKIQQELSHSSCEFQVTTSHVFQMLITNNLTSAEGTITAAFVQNIDSKDPIVANSWLEALLEIITLMPLKTVQTEILPLAIQKSQCTQPVNSRNAACRILGKISTHPTIKALEIKKDILPAVHGLCQDINYNVRATICEQIPFIVQGLGCNISKVNLLPNLVELSQDDNQNVRSIAVSSCINCLPHLDKDTKISTMIPLIFQFGMICMKPENISSALSLSKSYGLLLNCVVGCTTQNEVEVFIGYYIQLANSGLDLRRYSYNSVDTSQEVICRQYCAMNLPTVTLYVINNAPSYIDRVYDVCKTLASDSCFMVRQSIAGVLHEVGKTLGKQNVLLKTDFIRLLRDDAEEVLANLVPHLTQIFDQFTQTGILSIDRSTPQSVEISRALLKCLTQLKKRYNWRLLSLFLKQLEHLPKCFKADQIHNEFTQALVLCAVKGRTRPVREQACKTLLMFLRWNTRQIQRTWLKEKLINELAGSSNCYTRHIFILLCRNAIEMYSNKYFKDNFFYPLLSLIDDPVSTVRYSVVSLLPTLKRMLKLPTDRKLVQSLEHIIINLEKTEKDRDVLTNLITRSKEMMVQSTVKQDEFEATQRQLLEEEELVFKGHLSFSHRKSESTTKVTVTKKESTDRARTYKGLARSSSVTRTGPSRTSNSSLASTIRSTSVPRTTRPTTRTVNAQVSTTSNREIMSEMTFLNQHFITDAGVPLPIKNLESSDNIQPKVDDIDMIPLSTDKTEELFNIDNTLSSLNITDDVKVNMRKLSKKVNNNKRYSSEIPKAISDNNRKKRYSSIHSENEIAVKNIQTDKRRSLIVGSKDMSKIPISLKQGDYSDDKKIGNEHLDEDKSKKFSNLPVPVKRKQM